jgi:homoserine dehydrogenase
MKNELRIGIAGLGTVGQASLQLLLRHSAWLEKRAGTRLTIAAVSARDRQRTRTLSLEEFRWYDDPLDMARANDLDIIVELIGGADGVAKALVETALDNNKHVVSANKALIARHGIALARKAEGKGLALNFEAAVAGGIPIVKTLRESLSGNAISSIHGILNGTSNYILTEMEMEGSSFEDVLFQAQQLGFAEADPAFDINGTDAAQKLAILTSLAFGVQPDLDSVYIEGIERIDAIDIEFAEIFDYRIKLLGIARPVAGGIEQRVHPCMVPLSAPLADVTGVYNAILTQGDFVGRSLLEGRGAGGAATASAVIADLLDIARGSIFPVFGLPVGALKTLAPASMDDHACAYYLRFSVYDRPGVLAHLAQHLADEDVSIESMVQRGQAPGEPVFVVMITHETREAPIARALEKIAGDGEAIEPPLMIRIEDIQEEPQPG